jgi:hypothetical protein
VVLLFVQSDELLIINEVDSLLLSLSLKGFFDFLNDFLLNRVVLTFEIQAEFLYCADIFYDKKLFFK